MAKNNEIEKLLNEDVIQNDNCNLCKEARLVIGENIGYGAIIYRIGTLKNGWFATLSPKTGGDPKKDFTIQLMPFSHLTHFSQMASHPGLGENYGTAFSRICGAMTQIIMQDEGLKANSEEGNLSVSIGTYGKTTTWKEKKEHLHIKIFPFRGNIGQPYTVDSSFGKKEVFKEKTGEEFVKMKPVKKVMIDEKRSNDLAKRLIYLLRAKMSGKVDLQNHTVASDGELTPEELVDLAIEKKLKAIAITDHDSLGSVEAAIKYSNGKNIEIIPGIELSCDDPLLNYDKIDVLGLFIDPKNKKMIELIKKINERREENKKRIINKLKILGYSIEYEDVKKTVKGTFGRPHIAKYLLKKYPDEFASVGDVFDKLIGVGKKAFVETQDRVPIKDAIKIIKESKGIAILAHPGIYPRQDSVKLIDYFIENGGDGIETYYPYHIICPYLNIDEEENKKLVGFYRKITKSKKILESGGNDHHGKYRSTLGIVEVPYKVLENLRNRLTVS